LRICTPLLPLPLASRTWKLSSKSPYCFLLHRKVLKLMPLPVSPTRAPFLTDQYSVSPSQPSRFLPLKNAVVALSAVVSSGRPVPLPTTGRPAPITVIGVERLCCLRSGDARGPPDAPPAFYPAPPRRDLQRHSGADFRLKISDCRFEEKHFFKSAIYRPPGCLLHPPRPLRIFCLAAAVVPEADPPVSLAGGCRPSGGGSSRPPTREHAPL